MLYYATVILLHRPFNSTSTHHLECSNASHCLERLVICLDNTFGLTRLTYLISYCIYTGASVIVNDVNSGDLSASMRMRTFLRALQSSVTTCPVVQRSLDIINNSLTSQTHDFDTSQAAEAAETAEATTTEPSTGRYLPAFPVPESEVANYEFNFNTDNLDMDNFSLLNCFPEYSTNNMDPLLYMT